MVRSYSVGSLLSFVALLVGLSLLVVRCLLGVGEFLPPLTEDLANLT